MSNSSHTVVHKNDETMSLSTSDHDGSQLWLIDYLINVNSEFFYNWSHDPSQGNQFIETHDTNDGPMKTIHVCSKK